MTRPTMDDLRAMMPTKGQGRGLYAATPGTGPAGMTCHECAYLRYMRAPSKHPKCGKTNYTHGDATTIRTSTAACKLFEPSAGGSGESIDVPPPQSQRHPIPVIVRSVSCD